MVAISLAVAIALVGAGNTVTWPHMQKGLQREASSQHFGSLDANYGGGGGGGGGGQPGHERGLEHQIAWVGIPVQPFASCAALGRFRSPTVSQFPPPGNGMVIITSQRGLLGGVNEFIILRTSSW